MSALFVSRVVLGTALILGSLLCGSSAVEAATVGYWRFEDSPGFLNDSSGNGITLTPSGTAPTQTAIPGSGDGSDFPTTIPQTEASNGFMASTNGGVSHFSAGDAFYSNTMTIEAMINKQAQTSGTQYVVGQWNTSGNQRGFGFGIGGTSHATIGVNELFFVASDTGADTILVESGLFLNLNTDYYVGMSFDESNNASGVTFYMQDLTNGGPLISSTLPHGVLNDLNNSTEFIRIAALNSSSSRLEGLIDEVRISDVVLSSSDLLISSLPAPIPEPSALAMVLLGGLGLLMKRRRKV